MKMLTIAIGFLALGTVAASADHQGRQAYARNDTNMRDGPGLGHPLVAVVPRESLILVTDCNGNNSWCLIEWRQFSGWVSINFLDYTDSYVDSTYYDYLETNYPPVILRQHRPRYRHKKSHRQEHRRDWKTKYPTHNGPTNPGIEQKPRQQRHHINRKYTSQNAGQNHRQNSGRNTWQKTGQKTWSRNNHSQSPLKSQIPQRQAR